MKVGNLLFGIFVIMTLSACASVDIDSRRVEAFSIAKKAGFQPLRIQSKAFGFLGFYKQGNEFNNPIIYIEGDGLAWIDRYTISNNPTPINPLALRLAVLDTSPTVFYLARPCQYVDLRNEPNCNDAYWTNARFAVKVIDSFNQALDQIKHKTNNLGFHLVGFSGGGAIVTLLAAKRNDIVSIRTVAGNLDHISLNKYRKVSPLDGSLNPANIAQKIKHIPQIHYSGREDKVVPSWVAERFVQASARTTCISTHLLSGVGHVSGWDIAWGNLHKQIPQC